MQGDSETGLVLPGGGARNAYQAGVLAAIAEMWPHAHNPFPVICGTSAGAINAAVLACNADRFRRAASRLEGVWAHFRAHKVFRTDALAVSGNVLRWLGGMLSGGALSARAILDPSPLRGLLESHVRLPRVQQMLDQGHLQALAVTCSGYTSGLSLCHFQAHAGVTGWQRTRRAGMRDEISMDHLMASSALPVLLPAVRIGGEYCGDGSMREIAPLSPALHLGARRLLIIGVRERNGALPPPDARPPYPSIGQIGGYVLDTLFLDNLDTDVERLLRINRTLTALRQGGLPPERPELHEIGCLVIAPSEAIHDITARHMREMPLSLRLLLRSLGAFNPEGVSLASYLLFEPGYCQALIALGRRDAKACRDDILGLLGA